MSSGIPELSEAGKTAKARLLGDLEGTKDFGIYGVKVKISHNPHFLMRLCKLAEQLLHCADGSQQLSMFVIVKFIFISVPKPCNTRSFCVGFCNDVLVQISQNDKDISAVFPFFPLADSLNSMEETDKSKTVIPA